MRKPVYLAVLGISIIVAAASLGVTVTRYLGLLGYSPKGAAHAVAAAAGPVVPAIPPEEWSNLFAPGDGMKMASRLAAANAKTASQAPRTSFVLVGTIASSSPAARRAFLWANGMKEPKAFREKEEVEPGAFLATVERDKVWITRGKEREKLEIVPAGSRARTTATETPAVASTAASVQPPDRMQAVSPGASPGAADEEGPSRPELRRRGRGSRR